MGGASGGVDSYIYIYFYSYMQLSALKKALSPSTAFAAHAISPRAYAGSAPRTGAPTD